MSGVLLFSTGNTDIPGALLIPKGAVPEKARGLFHMAPTYLCRFPESDFSIGRCGSPFLLEGGVYWEEKLWLPAS